MKLSRYFEKKNDQRPTTNYQIPTIQIDSGRTDSSTGTVDNYIDLIFFMFIKVPSKLLKVRHIVKEIVIKRIRICQQFMHRDFLEAVLQYVEEHCHNTQLQRPLIHCYCHSLYVLLSCTFELVALALGCHYCQTYIIPTR